MSVSPKITTLSVLVCLSLIGCRAYIEEVPETNDEYLEPASGGGCPEGHLDDPWENPDSPHIGGEQSHDVTVSIASDFRCPYCANFALMSKTLIEDERYKNRVRFYFHHYPIESLHPGTADIHAATAAISNQSHEQFWAVHDMIFKQRAEGRIVELSDIKDFVADQGLDQQQFASDMESNDAYKIVNEDQKKAASLGIKSTPSVLVCGKKLNNWGNLSQALDHYLGENNSE